jgi:hypothetical protein
MPKKHSRADLRKRLNAEAKRRCISVADLKNRLKSDGDAAAHLSQDDDTSNENSPSTVEEQEEAVTQGVHAVLREEAREGGGARGGGRWSGGHARGSARQMESINDAH